MNLNDKGLQEITVIIPPDYVLIKKADLQEILDQNDDRVWIGFADVEELTGLRRNKLDDILKRYRDEIDVFKGGFVKFPDGGKWSFNKAATLKWLEDNHTRIWQEERRQ